MKDSQDLRKDELLEMLWHLSEHHKLTLSMLREHDPSREYEKSLYDFRSNGVLSFDGENISFNEKGRIKAEGIIRRHRLAECLMTSVLGKNPQILKRLPANLNIYCLPRLSNQSVPC